MKICTKCRKSKQLTSFSKLSKAPDGLQSNCKQCFSEYNKLHYAKNADKKKAQVRERAERIGYSNIYEANRQWYQEHYKKNREKIIQRTKAYAKANKEQKRAIKARRRARTLKAMSKIDRFKSVNYRKIIANRPCHYCGGFSTPMHDDHYYPLAKGGTDHWFNIVRSCSTCNWKKNARLASSL